MPNSLLTLIPPLLPENGDRIYHRQKAGFLAVVAMRFGSARL